MKVTVTEWFVDPLVPVITIWNVPCFCWLFTVRVRFEVPDVLMEVGASTPVTSEGNPETLRFTVPLKPAWAVIVIGSEPLWPRLTVKVFADEIVKSPAPFAFTTNVTPVVWTRVPFAAVPVIVTK